MQIPECVITRFHDDEYNEYRNKIVPEVYYEDAGMYVSDGDYMSEDEFVKELDSSEIYKYIYEIKVSEDALITDLKYYFDDMMFKNNDKWYVYAVDFEMFFECVVMHTAIKFVSGFIKLNDNIFKWNNGMIVDENDAILSSRIRPCVHDSDHFRENVLEMYEKKDDVDVQNNLDMMFERAIYEHRINDLKWIMNTFPDLLQYIYEFDYMSYLIYHDDIEVFKWLLPVVKTLIKCNSMLKTAIKYDKQTFIALLIHK